MQAAPPYLPSLPYISFYVAARVGGKEASIECHLIDSSESAGAADVISKMAAPSGHSARQAVTGNMY